MTLVVGFVSADHAVMAADSQATEADGTRTRIEKIWHRDGLLLGYTGVASLRDTLAEQIADTLSRTEPEVRSDREAMRDLLCVVTKPVLDRAYNGFVPERGEKAKEKIGGALLVMGNDSAGHWLLEVNCDNTPSWYSERGFHAVGTGSAAAQVAAALLQNYIGPARSLRELQMLAYRTVSVSVSVLAQYVSEPIHVWTSSANGAFLQMTDTEIEDLKRSIEFWEGLERETLSQAVGLAPRPDSSLPEQLEP